MRHAQAELAVASDASDADRALTPRGRHDAAAVGRWLQHEEIEPDHALVSTAVRTWQTWEALANEAQWTLVPDLDRSLYTAGPESALESLQASPDDARTVLLIGHNPTVAALAWLLHDGSGDQGALHRLAQGHAPADLAVLAVDGPWTDLGPGSARLVAFHSAH